jgi:hypothetical protein
VGLTAYRAQTDDTAAPAGFSLPWRRRAQDD